MGRTLDTGTGAPSGRSATARYAGGKSAVAADPPRYGVPMPATVHVRELTADDLDAAWELGRFAFGSDPQRPAPPASTPMPGLTRYGAFDDAGRLWARPSTCTMTSGGPAGGGGRRRGRGGRRPRSRGRGVARALLTALLRGARDRQAAISALYPTVAAPYRACGWEAAGVLRTVDLATAALPRHRPASHLTVRAGTPADLPAVDALYELVTRHRNGMLTRRGELFDERRRPWPARRRGHPRRGPTASWSVTPPGSGAGATGRIPCSPSTRRWPSPPRLPWNSSACSAVGPASRRRCRRARSTATPSAPSCRWSRPVTTSGTWDGTDRSTSSAR